MLNVAIGLYMIVSSVSGTQQTMAPVSATPTIISEVSVTKVEEKKNSEPIKSRQETEAYVKEYFKDVPILAEVARCESEFRHTDSKGNLIRGLVDNADVGVMQINERYHLKQAVALDINIHTIDGNLEYARQLYEKQGVYPWMASSACWSGASKEIAKR